MRSSPARWPLLGAAAATGVFVAAALGCGQVRGGAIGQALAALAMTMTLVGILARREGLEVVSLTGSAPGLRAMFVGLFAGLLTATASSVLCRIIPDPLGLFTPSRLVSEGPIVTPLVTLSIWAIAEEVFFRGYIFARVESAAGTRAALVSAAVLFSISHIYPFEWPQQLLSGLVYGLVRAWSGALAPAVIAHLIHNVLVVFSARH